MEGNLPAVDSKMLRKTNYVAGVSDMGNRFDSMYKEAYIEHPPHQNQQLNEEVRKDLRAHHFQLGFNDHNIEDKTSENHTEYVQKSIPQADKDQIKKMKELVSSSVCHRR